MVNNMGEWNKISDFWHNFEYVINFCRYGSMFALNSISFVVFFFFILFFGALDQVSCSSSNTHINPFWLWHHFL